MAPADISLCDDSKAEDSDGRPMRNRARAKKSHGAVRIHTDGFSLNIAYHTPDAMRKTAPRMYTVQASCQFCPDSRVTWKLVAQSIYGYTKINVCGTRARDVELTWPKAIMMQYRVQPPISRCIKICRGVMTGSLP